MFVYFRNMHVRRIQILFLNPWRVSIADLRNPILFSYGLG